MNTRKLVQMALFIALGIVLPMGFHLFGLDLGKVLAPMHLPVYLAGGIAGPMVGIVVGALSPLLSSLLTGMPPMMPMLPIMFFELMVYGLAFGFLYYSRRNNLYLSLIISIFLGRITAGIVVLALVHLFSITYLPANPLIYIWGTIIKGLPGIILQLILIPLLIKYLNNYQQANLAGINS